MPVEPREELLTRLRDAATRMKRVREVGSKLRLIRQGGEPGPTPTPGGLSQPATGFVGQPEGPNAPTG